MTRKTMPAPLDHEAVRAEREGDFARARALSAKLCAEGSAGPMPAAGDARRRQHGGVGQERTVQAAQDRLRRLGTDPLAWQVGLAALCAYSAAWIYALAANR